MKRDAVIQRFGEHLGKHGSKSIGVGTEAAFVLALTDSLLYKVPCYTSSDDPPSCRFDDRDDPDSTQEGRARIVRAGLAGSPRKLRLRDREHAGCGCRYGGGNDLPAD